MTFYSYNTLDVEIKTKKNTLFYDGFLSDTFFVTTLHVNVVEVFYKQNERYGNKNPQDALKIFDFRLMCSERNEEMNVTFLLLPEKIFFF